MGNGALKLSFIRNIITKKKLSTDNIAHNTVDK